MVRGEESIDAFGPRREKSLDAFVPPTRASPTQAPSDQWWRAPGLGLDIRGSLDGVGLRQLDHSFQLGAPTLLALAPITDPRGSTKQIGHLIARDVLRRPQVGLSSRAMQLNRAGDGPGRIFTRRGRLKRWRARRVREAAASCDVPPCAGFH